MNKTIGLQLLVYSFLLAGLGYLTHYLAPTFAKPTLITSLVGGALCLIWGFRAVAGSRGKALPILTLIPVNFIMISQTVTAWLGGAAGRAAAAVVTVLFAMSIAMLMRIAYAGALTMGQMGAAGNAHGGANHSESKPTGRRK